MRVLIDTNVVLDFLLEREAFVEAAANLFAKIDDGQIQGFVTATTIREQSEKVGFLQAIANLDNPITVRATPVPASCFGFFNLLPI